MEWVLIGLFVLAILVNIRSFVLLNQLKQQKSRFDSETADIYRNLEMFTADIEEKNEELYKEFLVHIENKEAQFNERLLELEEKLGSQPNDAPVVDEDIASLDAGFEDNKKVETLHKQGFSPEQIAKVLRLELGKTELIVNMLNRKRSYQK
ncbi:hypothetical protein [Planococcus lenghuensis]|uniref:Uncharacterized protein n=1 Tax=Planococcus lenghuensis TaxID=2213202 RepID=A0A1Q2L163_9BACL|nr:hypothetical protein [Planococcus lenghuensis]AQQ54114.1 hypothetical protein B0X71_14050 [Planococcus lenghuensis]